MSTRAPEVQVYNPAFLEERWVFDGFLPPYKMNPDLIRPSKIHGQAFKLCGRCNLRRHWDAWRCRTVGCPFEHRLPMDVIPASSVMGDSGYDPQRHGVAQDKILEAEIQCQTRKHGLFGKWPSFFARTTILHNGGHVLTNVTTDRVRVFNRKHHPPARPLDSLGRNWQQTLAWASLYKRYLKHRTKKRAARRFVAPFDHFTSSTLRKWFWDTTKVYTKALQTYRREPKIVRASSNATVCKVKH